MENKVTGELSKAGAEVKAKATAIIPVLRASARECDAMGKLNDEVLRAMSDAGIWKMGAPERFGGFAPLPVRDMYEIIIEVGKGNLSAAWAASINASAIEAVQLFSEQAQEEVFSSGHIGPYTAGSGFNLSYATGEARKVDGGYMVKGEWSFSSNVRNAAWQVVGVSLLGEDGTPGDRIRVLIPRAEIKVADDWKVSGMKASNSNTGYVTEEVFVPEYRARVDSFMNSFANKGQGAPKRPAVGSGLAVGLAAMAIGGAYGAMEVFTTRATTRKPWGQSYPSILAMPTTQVTIAKLRVLISFCEAAMRRIFEFEETGADRGDDSAPAETLYSVVYVVNQLKDAVSELQNIMGASTAAISDELGRFVQDMRVLSLHGMLRLDWMMERYGRKLAGMPDLPLNLDSEGTKRKVELKEFVEP